MDGPELFHKKKLIHYASFLGWKLSIINNDQKRGNYNFMKLSANIVFI